MPLGDDFIRPPEGGWGPKTTVALLVFIAVMVVVCLIAESRGQLTP